MVLQCDLELEGLSSNGSFQWNVYIWFHLMAQMKPSLFFLDCLSVNGFKKRASNVLRISVSFSCSTQEVVGSAFSAARRLQRLQPQQLPQTSWIRAVTFWENSFGSRHLYRLFPWQMSPCALSNIKAIFKKEKEKKRGWKKRERGREFVFAFRLNFLEHFPVTLPTQSCGLCGRGPSWIRLGLFTVARLHILERKPRWGHCINIVSSVNQVVKRGCFCAAEFLLLLLSAVCQSLSLAAVGPRRRYDFYVT